MNDVWAYQYAIAAPLCSQANVNLFTLYESRAIIVTAIAQIQR